MSQLIHDLLEACQEARQFLVTYNEHLLANDQANQAASELYDQLTAVIESTKEAPDECISGAESNGR